MTESVENEILIEVNKVSKKFCKDLKRSLWYGAKELAADFMGIAQDKSALRKDEFWAVKDISFQLRRGECLGLIGHNGAGKSTLLKMLNGLIRPDEGEIRMRGRIGALIELGAGFNPVLTGRENVYINGQILGFSKKEIDQKFEAIVDFAEIGDFLDSPVQNYSSGMKVRLGFAVAAQMEPDILIVDEVLAVGDVGFRMKCYDIILKMKEKGTAIILVTHSMLDLQRVSNTIILLNKGEINLKTTDLSTAISQYEISSIKQNIDSNDVNKNIQISKIIPYNSEYVQTTNFSTGDDLLVKVEIDNSWKFLPSCRFIVHIESPSLGNLGSFSSPFKNAFFDISEGKSEVWFKIHKIPLLKGRYFINVSINGKSITEHYHWNRQQCIFNIVGPEVDTFGYGICHSVYFEHDWVTQEVVL